MKILPILKNGNLSTEDFIKRVATGYKFMTNVKKTRLDSSYLQQLEEFVEKLVNGCNTGIENLNNFQEELLKDYNLAQKEKNRLSYKKEKYKNRSFNDGY